MPVESTLLPDERLVGREDDVGDGRVAAAARDDAERVRRHRCGAEARSPHEQAGESAAGRRAAKGQPRGRASSGDQWHVTHSEIGHVVLDIASTCTWKLARAARPSSRRSRPTDLACRPGRGGRRSRPGNRASRCHRHAPPLPGGTVDACSQSTMRITAERTCRTGNRHRHAGACRRGDRSRRSCRPPRRAAGRSASMPMRLLS